MQTQKRQSLRAAVAAALVALAINACATNDNPAAAITAPNSLGYGAKTLTFAQNVSVAKNANVIGSVNSCSVTPALPAGLSIDDVTCALNGTPTVTQAATAYTITASNSAGTTTAAIKIAVVQYSATMQANPAHGVGKTTFQIKITDSTGVGIPGLNPQIVPEMDMVTMVHTTPVDTITDNGSGLYTAVVYYLMSSGGGSWYIKTMSGMTEIATRIPITVGGMGTTRASMSHTSDQYSNMGTATNRPYFVFIDEITGSAGNHTVKIFAATRKSMMAHPALDNGLTLADETSANWNVSSLNLTLEFSIKDSNGNIISGPHTYNAPTNNGSGRFTFNNVTQLTNNASQELKFTVALSGHGAATRGPASLNAAIP